MRIGNWHFDLRRNVLCLWPMVWQSPRWIQWGVVWSGWILSSYFLYQLLWLPVQKKWHLEQQQLNQQVQARQHLALKQRSLSQERMPPINQRTPDRVLSPHALLMWLEKQAQHLALDIVHVQWQAATVDDEIQIAHRTILKHPFHLVMQGRYFHLQRMLFMMAHHQPSIMISQLQLQRLREEGEILVLNIQGYYFQVQTDVKHKTSTNESVGSRRFEEIK